MTEPEKSPAPPAAPAAPIKAPTASAAPDAKNAAAPKEQPINAEYAAKKFAEIQKTIETAKEKRAAIRNDMPDQIRMKHQGEVAAQLGKAHAELEKMHASLHSRITDLKTKQKQGTHLDEVRDLPALEEIKISVGYTKRDLEMEDNRLKGVGKGLAWIGDKLGVVASYISDGAEVIWKYTLGPVLSGLGKISEQPRAAMAEWLRTSKIPGGSFIANLLHRSTATLTPDQQKEKEFDTLTSLFTNNGITLALANTDTASKIGMLTEIDALLSEYNDKTGLTSARDGYVRLVVKALKEDKKTSVAWQEFTAKADALNKSAQRVVVPAGYVAAAPVTTSPTPAQSTAPNGATSTAPIAPASKP